MARSSDLDVAYVARLARINLTEAEAKVFQKQLDECSITSKNFVKPT